MKSILIVDDEPEILELAGRALAAAGYRVEVAGDGREAIGKLEAARFDLVVTDVIMPGQEGVETIMEIKRRWPDCRVVAISGGGRLGAQDFLHLAMALGADATMAKPLRFRELTALVADVLASPPARAALAS